MIKFKVPCSFSNYCLGMCGKTHTRWTNTKGQIFYLCDIHLEMLKSTVETYEQTGPNEYRVVLTQPENDNNIL